MQAPSGSTEQHDGHGSAVHMNMLERMPEAGHPQALSHPDGLGSLPQKRSLSSMQGSVTITVNG